MKGSSFMKETNPSEYAANVQVARYLKRASRGLWGEQRSRLRDELSIHIEGLINSYRMAGIPLDDAVEKALAEMGPAANVSVGVAQVHTLPLISMMSLLLVSVITVIMMLAPSVAQSLTSLATLPTTECFADAETAWYCSPEDWVSTDELASLLEVQGITTDAVGDSLFIQVPGYSKVLLYGGTQDYTFYGIYDGEESVQPVTTENGYVQLRSFLESLAIRGVPIKLGGWDTLDFSIADRPFKLNYNGSYNAKAFFTTTLYTLSNLAPMPGTSYTTVNKELIPTKSQTFAVDALENDVYGVTVVLDDKTFAELIPEAQTEETAAFYQDIARVGADGQLSLELPDIEGLDFVSSVDTLVGNGKALLVKLTGEVGDNLYTIVPAPAM